MDLPSRLHAAILIHCRAGLPNEACGILAGPPGGRPRRHVPMVNADPAPDRFAMDPEQQIAVWTDMDQAGEDPLVVYHSHPRGAPVPSPQDIAWAADPEPVYLIVSLATEPPHARAWRIRDGQATEEPIRLVD